MGFYIEMAQVEPKEQLFAEKGVPSTFWVLYGIALFAVICMGTAASSVLLDLFRQGSGFDRFLLFMIFLVVPIVFFIGLKLALLRKFVEFTEDRLVVGFRVPLRNAVLFKKSFPKSAVTDIFLINKRQSANHAKREHKDQRYHIRGHWKIIAEANGKRTVLDRHTERESLEPLYDSLKRWLGK